ncbi:MAG: CPBP family intramembrane metalloprotease [Cyclobacteriaceae bacterium]
MQNILKDQSSNPGVSLLILVAMVVVGLLVFQVLGVVFSLPLFGLDLDMAVEIMENPYSQSDGKAYLIVIQAFTSIGAFIITPLVFIRYILKLNFLEFTNIPKPAIQPILMTVVLVFCFMIANSALIEFNQNLTLPDFLSGFEKWARDYEDAAERLTIYLTQFDSVGYFLVTVVIIAVVPAIGEELLFRGLIQNLFNHIIKNHHLAIWISALLFSAFHFQFYGIIPRMMLGVLFGYIYLWSGSLTLAMVGHFVNNALSLSMMYLSQTGSIDITAEDLESSLPFYVILLFLAAGTLIMFLFRKYFSLTPDE